VYPEGVQNLSFLPKSGHLHEKVTHFCVVLLRGSSAFFRFSNGNHRESWMKKRSPSWTEDSIDLRSLNHITHSHSFNKIVNRPVDENNGTLSLSNSIFRLNHRQQQHRILLWICWISLIFVDKLKEYCSSSHFVLQRVRGYGALFPFSPSYRLFFLNFVTNSQFRLSALNTFVKGRVFKNNIGFSPALFAFFCNTTVVVSEVMSQLSYVILVLVWFLVDEKKD
jgi:hypothetical protein